MSENDEVSLEEGEKVEKVSLNISGALEEDSPLAVHQKSLESFGVSWRGRALAVMNSTQSWASRNRYGAFILKAGS